MHLSFTPLAEQDLEDIADYIALDSPGRALGFVGELRVQCQRIARNPLIHRRRPELGDDIRSCAYGRYVIFFEMDQDALVILRILHGARDIAAIFSTDTD